jgi:apolipoprotein N-acyltransferase
MVLMPKASYVYRKTMLCFHSTPTGSYNRRGHCFYKYMTSSRSNFISVISFLFAIPKSKFYMFIFSIYFIPHLAYKNATPNTGEKLYCFYLKPVLLLLKTCTAFTQKQYGFSWVYHFIYIQCLTKCDIIIPLCV